MVSFWARLCFVVFALMPRGAWAQETAETLAPKRVLVVADAGAAPREVLRYEVPAGATFDHHVRVASTTTINARLEMRSTMELVLRIERDANGGRRHRFATRDLVMTNDDGRSAALDKVVASIPAVRGTFDVDERGAVTQVTMLGTKPKATMAGAVETELRALVTEIVQHVMFVPFPRVPLGVGARYEVREQLAEPGKATRERVVSYAISSVNATDVAVTVEVRDDAKPQRVKNLLGDITHVSRYEGRVSGNAQFTRVGLRVTRKTSGTGIVALEDGTSTKAVTEVEITPRSP